jgi:hypothetical protein
VPEELERVIDKALQKDRNLRCWHFRDLRTDLHRLKRDSSDIRPASFIADPSGRPQPVGPPTLEATHAAISHRIQLP